MSQTCVNIKSYWIVCINIILTIKPFWLIILITSNNLNLSRKASTVTCSVECILLIKKTSKHRYKRISWSIRSIRKKNVYVISSKQLCTLDNILYLIALYIFIFLYMDIVGRIFGFYLGTIIFVLTLCRKQDLVQVYFLGKKFLLLLHVS